ncbi:Virulence protein-like protein [Desulfatibacillum aliphaticivorans]|uniref:Virulence protein-like protein n=1 Tax=Desulfatibacillum aliphaticivorans TaxID=218208 RepID=B8FD15_DESAL|nr:RhuM family protein [Desulfatibacillum aliphaticivorans]ACL06446.1 Virulence protein-like protein [Desulfatibacillum aliphaticivorans]
MSKQSRKSGAGRQLIRNSTAEFLIFTGQAGEQSIEARHEDETIWLTQKLMAALFDVDVRTVSEHLANIFQQGELDKDSVIRKFRNTAADGKQYLTQFYNLDAIISVGYRVKSIRATQFRQWATSEVVSARRGASWTASATWGLTTLTNFWNESGTSALSRPR